jgi:replicative DNA helicase
LPTLFDLKESGDIEAAADVVIILHELDANPVAKTILAIIAKQRNGPTGDRKILFFPEILRFENCAREEV